VQRRRISSFTRADVFVDASVDTGGGSCTSILNGSRGGGVGEGQGSTKRAGHRDNFVSLLSHMFKYALPSYNH